MCQEGRTRVCQSANRYTHRPRLIEYSQYSYSTVSACWLAVADRSNTHLSVHVVCRVVLLSDVMYV